MLDIDSLITIPLSIPLKGPGMLVTPQDFEKAVQKITKNLEDELGNLNSKNPIEGTEIAKEFDLIKEETKKNENKGLSPETIGIQIPEYTNVDETKDSELIFNYTWQWIYRPLLNNIIGKARIVEAFYQYLSLIHI